MPTQPFYQDLDGDGYGNAAVSVIACVAPSGYVANGTDCNDNCGTCYPTAPEICDSKDNDCDGLLDEGNVCGNPFVTTWKTDNPGTSGSTSITIPTTGGGYSYDVDWDNDGSYDQVGITGNVTHDFSTAGTYTIRIKGNFPRIFFDNGGDHQKLLSIDAWGDIAWGSMNNAFVGCSNMTYNATDVPNLAGVTDLLAMFANCTAFNGAIGNWNTQTVTSMSFMFMNNTSFNQSLNNWNTGAVQTMTGMFRGASSFNQPLANWNTGSVVSLSSMFDGATSFNQPIGNWNTGAAVNLNFMFKGATSFNQPLANWATGTVQMMTSMFEGATSFNQSLGTWTLHPAVSMTNMLNNCGMDCVNYSATLIGWSANPATPNDRSLGASGRIYESAAVAARTNLTTAKGWTINGDAIVSTVFYADADGDGYGNPAASQNACSQPAGYLTDNTDCNDNSAAQNPMTVWYKDADNDGYSDGASLTQCAQPAGYKMATNLAGTSGDCNEGNAQINPGAAETCNGIDDDCDNLLDTADPNLVDNTPPSVTCKDLPSLMLDPTGNVQIDPASIFLAGSDNCGTVELLSATPSQLDCGNVGSNTVMLTVSDGHGNTATCTATVLVEPFITIDSIVVVDEECGGNNGGISVYATTLGGQLGYSITGGQTFELGGEFTDVSAGTYPLLVQAFGTSGCQVTVAEVTVGITGSAQTWYKDIDGDGYSDGNTLSDCVQPMGFHLAANLTATSEDCDDSDPLERPGQAWFRDWDNDGYSNGVVLVQCLRPNGFKVQGELAGTGIDCNDANSQINLAATEVCNGIDDDCDGLIDEGGSGGQTYVGHITLTSETEVNAFSQCYSVIQGNLTVQNSSVVTLLNLANLVKVTGNVTIKNTSLVNLNGLHNLDTIGGNLTINGNNFGQKLQSLDGLEDLNWVGGNLKVYSNTKLSDCCAIHHLIGAEPNGVGGVISIYSNAPNLGCTSVPVVLATCGGQAIIAPPASDGARNTAHGAQAAHRYIEVFPNPVSSSAGMELRVRIEGDFAEGYLRVYDATGRAIFLQDLPEGTSEWHLQTDGWKPGIYLVQAFLDGQLLTQKLIVK